MKKIFIILLFIFILSGCSKNISLDVLESEAQSTNTISKTGYTSSSLVTSPDKVEVFLFHRTKRCPTCIAIGKLTEKTVQEKFLKEVENGRIVFKEINIDLPENRELAVKFKASGSALYINAIKNDQDKIEQDLKVWQLTGDEDAFIDYMENKLNNIISGNYGIY